MKHMRLPGVEPGVVATILFGNGVLDKTGSIEPVLLLPPWSPEAWIPRSLLLQIVGMMDEEE